MSSQQSTLETLERLREESVTAGGPKLKEKQHQKGKLTARERLNLLLDNNSFEEFDVLKVGRGGNLGDSTTYLGDGVITGHGTIDGREVFVFSQDFTIIGGSLGEAHAQKICKVMDLAVKVGAPIIGLNDSGGARIQEGVDALAAYGEIFHRNVRASGVVPQISCIMGPCAGGAVYSPSITDFVFMVEDSSYMFVTGPSVVKTVTHQDISSEDLGGASVHSAKSGVAHFTVANDVLCLREIRRLISYLPSNNKQRSPILDLSDSPTRTDPALDYLIPSNSAESYDMHVLINSILDGAEFMEVHGNLPATLSAVLAVWADKQSVLSPISLLFWPACLTTMPLLRPDVLSDFATLSTYHLFLWLMSPALCRDRIRSTVVLSGMEPSCSMLSPKQQSPEYRLSSVRHMAVPIW